MESVNNARKFMSAARAFARNKPIIVLKAGRSSEGAEAARSHTGALAGDDVIFEAAFKRAGIIRVNTIEELFDCAEALAKQKRPVGNRLAIVTNAGGPGVLATDQLVRLKGKMAKLSPDTLEVLNKNLPPYWSRGNPVDILGDANPHRYKIAVEACLQDKEVDAILVILAPQAVTDPLSVADLLVTVCRSGQKTILASWIGAKQVEEGIRVLEDGGIPVFNSPEDAVKCFMYMYQYSSHLELLYESPDSLPQEFNPDREGVTRIIDQAAKDKRYSLSEYETKQLLKNYQIQSPDNGVAGTPEEALEVARAIGFPVAMKVLSPDIPHKTDLGGVKLGISSVEEVLETYKTMIAAFRKIPDVEIQEVFIEKMVEKGYELIIGAKKDPVFGPCILFGQGGTAVEIMGDINIGLPPLNMTLAQRLIEETRIYQLLKGYRGIRAVDLKALRFLLYKFSYLLVDFPQIKELEINPFIMNQEQGMVVDAKLVLDKEVIQDPPKNYQHLVISPYPKEYESKLVLKNGLKVKLRPIRPEDEPLERDLFATFSNETKRFRFFGLITELTHHDLVRFTQIDYDREIAIVAEIDDQGKKRLTGVTRLVADPESRRAEFAIVVGDPWQGLGMGRELTDYIIKIARQRALKYIYANVLSSNLIMIKMLKKRGFKIRERFDDSCSLEKTLVDNAQV